MSDPTTPTAPILADGGAITKGTPQPLAGYDQAFIDLVAMCPTSWQGDEGFIQWAKKVYEAGGAAAKPAAPVITSITPDTVGAGAPDTGIAVAGTGFVDGAVVATSADLVTTFSSATALGATIPAAELAAAGTLNVTVRNPDSQTSAPSVFTVT